MPNSSPTIKGVAFGGPGVFYSTTELFPDRAVAELLSRLGSDMVTPERVCIAMRELSDAATEGALSNRRRWRKFLSQFKFYSPSDALVRFCIQLETMQVRAGCQQLPGMEETLAAFKEKLLLGMLPEVSPILLDYERDLGLPDAADSYAPSCEFIEMSKLKVLHVVLASLQVKAPSCLYVDSNPRHLAVAQKLGMPTVLALVAPGADEHADVIEALASPEPVFDHVIHALPEVVTDILPIYGIKL